MPTILVGMTHRPQPAGDRRAPTSSERGRPFDLCHVAPKTLPVIPSFAPNGEQSRNAEREASWKR